MSDSCYGGVRFEFDPGESAITPEVYEFMM
jgi:hypothetical protein